jgi:hypothetical protein
MDPVAAS